MKEAVVISLHYMLVITHLSKQYKLWSSCAPIFLLTWSICVWILFVSEGEWSS